ncbi:N-(5'-phosphoribosyl)anthranilate isomerase [Striga asiatica]|uniref:N-(5'-phosphoribosyl)anthranilate isomerase n=1 Tax=Striga asiatica TaxID=4170 RepID=A0A5A7PAM5_STRAF|nr:N-(5'-phosphoribosyl)anthranilate isomerase [Striga asiatica]
MEALRETFWDFSSLIMGCFLGCFGGKKDQRRRRRRLSRGSPQRQRNRVENVHHDKTVLSIKETVTISEQPIKETVTISEQPAKELQNKTEAVEQRSPSSSPSPSPKKRVTFNSDITTYEHVPVHDSIESLPECPENIEKEKEVPVDEEVESKPIFTRDRSVNSVLNPVENTAQWKVVKSKGTTNLLRPPPQKENCELPCVSLSSEPTFKNKTEQSRKNGNREVAAVDASLSNWLSSPEVTPPKKKTSDFGGFFETSISGKTNLSEGRNSVRSFEDRPILGALTVEELRQISATNSPRKSPSRSPDEMPIIGSVGTYWNDSSSKKQSDYSSSFNNGIPNTSSKYREDKRVNWNSMPFEARLESALLSQGAS